MEFEELQRTFKRLNPNVLRLWRWHVGWMMSAVPPLTGKTMVVSHVGRTSGLRRQTPLNYAVLEGDVWCTTNVRSQWLRNVEANPEVTVWLPLRRPRRGRATILPVDEAHVDRLRAVLLASGFAAERFGGLHPRRDTDAELLAQCTEYRLVRIDRGAVVPRAERRG
jgi:deazaflavin-dependent oxidoreductase (nitroreductase family)